MKKLYLSLLIIAATFRANKLLAQSANTSLSNLASATAVNHGLVPGISGSISLGSSSIGWKYVYLTKGIYINGTQAFSTPLSSNTTAGLQALKSITSGNNNSAYGYHALYNNTTGYSNVGIGVNALYNNTSGNHLIAIGDSALYNNRSGLRNTAIGSLALYKNTTGDNNTAEGYQALYVNTTGASNIAAGFQALYTNTTGSNNVANGTKALYLNTTGYSNIAFGIKALYNNKEGSHSVAIGDSALYGNNLYGNNIAIGSKALYSVTTGDANTATGFQALYSDTSGYVNNAYGYRALFNNTEGSYNDAYGYLALYSNTAGEENAAVGYQTLYSNTTGDENSAICFLALRSNTTGSQNTATGGYALYSNIDGDANTATGEAALLHNTSGGYNTAVGYECLYTNTTGSYNTAIGEGATIGSYPGNLSDATAIGAGAYVAASNQVRLGDTYVTSIGGYANWTNISDGRVKKNIKQNVPGLSFINKLQPVTYNLDLDAADRIIQRLQLKDKNGKALQPSQFETDARKAKEQVVYTGFVAQDVEKAAKSLNYDFSGVDAAKNDKDLYGLRYSDFVVPLVKAVQELSQQNDSLKKFYNEKLNGQQAEIDELKAMIVSGQSTTKGQQLSTVSFASLQQNVPNPFSNSTTIGYILPQQYSSAKIIITDEKGIVLKQASLNATGKSNLNVDTSTLAAGVYEYSLYVNGKPVDTKQMVLVR